MARRKKAAAHGGAWKVAYADFVTAMMALFMVLWISAQDKKILIATSQYFQNPFKALHQTTGVIPENPLKPTAQAGKRTLDEHQQNSRMDLTYLASLAREFYRQLHVDDTVKDKPILIQVTSDGLRVTLFNRSSKPLFRGNTAGFTEWGTFLMQNLAWLVDRHRFRVAIDGHTRSGVHYGTPARNDWNLSIDRADAARTALTYYAVSPAQIDRVTGFADTRPLAEVPKDSDSNDRVTLSLTLANRFRHDGGGPASAALSPASTGIVATSDQTLLFPVKGRKR
jgi:chemotaxis protein MotB